MLSKTRITRSCVAYEEAKATAGAAMKGPRMSVRTRMGIVAAAAAFALTLAGPAASAQPAAIAPGRSYELVFSTYFGEKMDCRGMCVDARGNAYLAGSTWTNNYPDDGGRIRPDVSRRRRHGHLQVVARGETHLVHA